MKRRVHSSELDRTVPMRERSERKRGARSENFTLRERREFFLMRKLAIYTEVL